MEGANKLAKKHSQTQPLPHSEWTLGQRGWRYGRKMCNWQIKKRTHQGHAFTLRAAPRIPRIRRASSLGLLLETLRRMFHTPAWEGDGEAEKRGQKIPHEQNRYLVGMLYSSLSEPSEWMLGTEGEENGREAHNLQKRKKTNTSRDQRGYLRLPIYHARRSTYSASGGLLPTPKFRWMSLQPERDGEAEDSAEMTPQKYLPNKIITFVRI